VAAVDDTLSDCHGLVSFHLLLCARQSAILVTARATIRAILERAAATVRKASQADAHAVHPGAIACVLAHGAMAAQMESRTQHWTRFTLKADVRDALPGSNGQG